MTIRARVESESPTSRGECKRGSIERKEKNKRIIQERQQTGMMKASKERKGDSNRKRQNGRDMEKSKEQ